MNTQTNQTTPAPLTPFELKTIMNNTDEMLNYFKKSKAIIKSWPLEVIIKEQGQLNVLQVLIDHFTKQLEGKDYAWD